MTFQHSQYTYLFSNQNPVCLKIISHISVVNTNMIQQWNALAFDN